MRFNKIGQQTNRNKRSFNLLSTSTGLKTCSGVHFETSLGITCALLQELLTLTQTCNSNIKILTAQYKVSRFGVNSGSFFCLSFGSSNFCSLRFLKARKNVFKFQYSLLILSQARTSLGCGITSDLLFSSIGTTIINRGSQLV